MANIRAVCLAAALICGGWAMACTSILVSARASATGRPLMWKHRDTGAESNFIDRVEPADGRLGYVALFNEGDTLRTEAWMGMNDAGFAVMNTASYNLAPDTATVRDMEGVLMSLALQRCVTVDDFEELLRSYPKPMGVQANFGVMDSVGSLAYFETDDYNWRRYDVGDSPGGYLIRTNHSFSGTCPGGMGYIRYDNLAEILEQELAEGRVAPEDLTERASRSFYHSLIGENMEFTPRTWVVDQDFIPRYISTASIVVEGAPDPADMVMWTALGYPPCAVTVPVTLQQVPEQVRPDPATGVAPAFADAAALKEQVFPVKRGNGQRYIDMEFLRPVNAACRAASLANYKAFRATGGK